MDGRTSLGISSGASVPKFLVDELVRMISVRFPDAVKKQDESIEKGIAFPLPKEIQDYKKQKNQLA